jgi:hypothetical protein
MQSLESTDASDQSRERISSIPHEPGSAAVAETAVFGPAFGAVALVAAVIGVAE